MQHGNDRRLAAYSGGLVDSFAPDSATFEIEDIARGLAYRGRWCGQTRKFYSVAEHCIWVSCKCSDPYRLWGLLHDAGEAFFGDVPAPHKDAVWFHLPDEQGVIQKVPFADAEDGLLHVVLRMAGLPVVSMPEEVHEADLIVRAWEHRELVHPETRAASTFHPMGPEEALEKWMAAYRGLKALLDAESAVAAA